MVATSLPLFPLGAVLFPGIPLPLHIFEDRYRRLVRDLVERPAGQRRFGVIAIRAGREVGVDGVDDLHPVGCAAELVRVQAYPDGRFDIIAVGVARFRLAELHVGDLAHGDVEFLADKTSDRSPALAATAGRVFTRYRASVLTAQGTPPDEDPHLPTDPVQRSFLIAEASVLDTTDKQRLLEAATVDERLTLEVDMLRREIRLMSDLGSRPAAELSRGLYSPN